MGVDILDDWGLTARELAEIVAENPSMRGLMFGFVAEYKLKKEWLLTPRITNIVRPRSHDRKQKCDFTFDYRGINVRLEVKCLDTPKVRLKEGIYTGTFQCNASDTTEVTLPNGRKVTTNCLVVDGFDVLAVCLFAFGKMWRFAFARNKDLPRTTWRGYAPAQQKYLLKSAMRISCPLEPPYVDDLFTILDRLVAERVRR
ncbi:MAG: restriction endonuclease [Terriglobia bacterium]